MHTLSIRRHAALAVGTAGLLAGSLAGPALATDTVTQTIVAGGLLSASVANLSLPDVEYDYVTHDVSGTMVLTADDSRGTSLGWSVSIQGSAFVYTGTAEGGIDIPAANFALTSAEEPTLIEGQPVDFDRLHWAADPDRGACSRLARHPHQDDPGDRRLWQRDV